MTLVYPSSKQSRLRLLVFALLMLAAVSQLGEAALIEAKAWLAPILIERAFERAAVGEIPDRAWPWADTRPLARLTVHGRDLQRYVLDDDSGHALAFGPGMAFGVRPGDPGLVMITGHRDTHFRVLEDLTPGETLELAYLGRTFRYQIERMALADARKGELAGPLPDEGLLLVTCYPFDAVLPGGPLRYVVIARRAG